MAALVNLTALQIQRVREALADEQQLKDEVTGQPRLATLEEVERYGKAAYRRLWDNYEARQADRVRIRVEFD